MPRTHNCPEARLDRARRRLNDLQLSKQIADEMCVMVGTPRSTPVEFPGVEEARAEYRAALREWNKWAEQPDWKGKRVDRKQAPF